MTYRPHSAGREVQEARSARRCPGRVHLDRWQQRRALQDQGQWQHHLPHVNPLPNQQGSYHWFFALPSLPAGSLISFKRDYRLWPGHAMPSPPLASGVAHGCRPPAKARTNPLNPGCHRPPHRMRPGRSLGRRLVHLLSPSGVGTLLRNKSHSFLISAPSTYHRLRSLSTQ